MLYGTMPRPVTITSRVGIITLNGVDSLMRIALTIWVLTEILYHIIFMLIVPIIQ